MNLALAQCNQSGGNHRARRSSAVTLASVVWGAIDREQAAPDDRRRPAHADMAQGVVHQVAQVCDRLRALVSDDGFKDTPWAADPFRPLVQPLVVTATVRSKPAGMPLPALLYAQVINSTALLSGRRWPSRHVCLLPLSSGSWPYKGGGSIRVHQRVNLTIRNLWPRWDGAS